MCGKQMDIVRFQYIVESIPVACYLVQLLLAPFLMASRPGIGRDMHADHNSGSVRDVCKVILQPPELRLLYIAYCPVTEGKVKDIVKDNIMHLPLIKRIVCRAEQRLECALRALVAPRVHIHVMVPDSTVERHAALRSGSHHRHEKRRSIVPLPYYVTASYSDSRKARGLHQMPHVSGGLLYIPYLLRFIYLDIGPEEKHVPGLILHGGANLEIHPEDFIFLIRDIPVKTRSIIF